MNKKHTSLTVIEPITLDAESEWIGNLLEGISKEARNTANEIVKKIEMAENHVVNARKAGNDVRRIHKIPLLPISLKSTSKKRHIDATMKNLDAVGSLFEVQQMYIELINQSTKFGREVNTALAALVEQSYCLQMGSFKKLSNESETAIRSLVQHGNTVMDIQERSSKQIMFAIILGGISLVIAVVSLLFTFIL